MLEIVYRWPDGREEVRYRRPSGSEDAERYIAEVNALQARLGPECPYFVRPAPSRNSTALDRALIDSCPVCGGANHETRGERCSLPM